MTRTARKISESGIYHVMARGVNKQPIFEETADYRKLVKVLADCKAIANFEMFAYCLMQNHFHLLIRPSEMEPLAQLFRRIGGRYVVWFNRKYGRTGHLFQDRFASEPIDGDPYFLSCARYILQNPVQAGICASPCDYEFSSMREYAARSGTLTDIDMLTEMVGGKNIVAFLSEEPTNRHIDVGLSRFRLTDDEARGIMQAVCGCSDTAEFQRLDKRRRDVALTQMGVAGVSIRQASRIAGVGTGVVRRCFGATGIS